MPAEEPVKTMIKEEPEKDLAVWTAPARPFKRRDKQFYVTVIGIAAIVGLVLFLVEGMMPVILLISLIFLFYVMSTVEPDKIQYKITNKGIKVAETRTDWTMTTRFWFSKRFDSDLLVVETLALPGRLEVVINPVDKEQIRKAVSAHIPEEEVPPTFTDKAANWFSQRLSQNK